MHRVFPFGVALRTFEWISAVNAPGVRVELNEAGVATFFVWTGSDILTVDHVVLH